jgi:hypothetical protein
VNEDTNAPNWDLPPGSRTGAGVVTPVRAAANGSGGGEGGGPRGGGGGANFGAQAAAAAGGAAAGGGAPRTPLERARAILRRAMKAWAAERRRGRRGRIIQHRPRLFYHFEDDAYLLVNPLGEEGQLRRILGDSKYEGLGVLSARETGRFGFAKENAEAAAAGRLVGPCFTSAVDPATGNTYYYVEGGAGAVRFHHRAAVATFPSSRALPPFHTHTQHTPLAHSPCGNYPRAVASLRARCLQKTRL